MGASGTPCYPCFDLHALLADTDFQETLWILQFFGHIRQPSNVLVAVTVLSYIRVPFLVRVKLTGYFIFSIDQWTYLFIHQLQHRVQFKIYKFLQSPILISTLAVHSGLNSPLF